MNRTEINWKNPAEGWRLDFTWNPLYGCRRNCFYCYARKVHDTRHEAYNAGKLQAFVQYACPFDAIQVFPKRFEQPAQINTPSTIFVDDMGDICFHAAKDVERVIDIARGCSQHRFMFLTQDYGFYNKFDWPDNAWLGITMVFGSLKNQPAFKSFKSLRHPHKFMSIEPIMGGFEGIDLSFVNLVIIGAMNHVKGAELVIPKAEWVNSIVHKNIHFKDLATKSLRSR